MTAKLRPAQFGEPQQQRERPQGIPADAIAISFPPHANLEFRWRFIDGTYSAWMPFPVGFQIAPPAARETGAIEWRPAMLRRTPDAPARSTVTPTSPMGQMMGADREPTP